MNLQGLLIICRFSIDSKFQEFYASRMASLIEERERLRSQRSSEVEAKTEAIALRARLINEESSNKWRLLSESISSLVKEHNLACSNRPRAMIRETPSSEICLIFSATVIEKVQGLWFAAPAPVDLEIRFDPTRHTIIYSVPGRTKSKHFYFELSRTGEVTLYRASTPLTIQEAANSILSTFLDVIDPIA
jgi:hypothetical protein